MPIAGPALMAQGLDAGAVTHDTGSVASRSTLHTPLRLSHHLRRGRGEDDFVVCGKRQAMLSYGTFCDHLRQLCMELKLPVVTPHELRHSATELWIEAGATEEDIVRLLNHSGAAAVRRYVHRNNDRLKRIAATIDIPVRMPE